MNVQCTQGGHCMKKSKNIFFIFGECFLLSEHGSIHSGVAKVTLYLRANGISKKQTISNPFRHFFEKFDIHGHLCFNCFTFTTVLWDLFL